MATKADIEIAKITMYSNFALAMIAAGVVIMGVGANFVTILLTINSNKVTSIINNLENQGMLVAIFGIVIYSYCLWLMHKVTPDSN